MGTPMAKYWIKIALRAGVIFLLGMAIVYAVRRGRNTVRTIAETAEPITIPIAFVPLRVNDTAFGSIRRVRLLRSTPKQVSGVEIQAKLADSVDADRFDHCLLAAEDVQNITPHSTLTCLAESDTAGMGLVPFGTVDFNDGDAVRPLLVPASEAGRIQDNLQHDMTAPAPVPPRAAHETPAVPAVPGVPDADSLKRAIHRQVDSALRAADSAVSRGLRTDSAARHRP